MVNGKQPIDYVTTTIVIIIVGIIYRSLLCASHFQKHSTCTAI